MTKTKEDYKQMRKLLNMKQHEFAKVMRTTNTVNVSQKETGKMPISKYDNFMLETLYTIFQPLIDEKENQ